MDLYTRLKSLVFRNFRCFRTEQRIDFPATGLYLVRGENEDTSGASGAGKTSFIKAISFAGGYESQPANKLKCWTADGPMVVEETLANEHGTATIRRGAKTSVTINGKPGAGGAEAQEFAFTDFVGGLPPDVLSAVTYRAQKKPGLFLSRPDGERKSFLATLLGLGQFEDEAARATKRAGELAIEAQGFENALKHNEAAFGQVEAASYPRKDTAQAEADVKKTEEAIAQIREQVTKGEAELAEMEQVLKAALQQASADTREAINAVERERDAARAARVPLDLTELSKAIETNEGFLKTGEVRIQTIESEAATALRAREAEARKLEREADAIEVALKGRAAIEKKQEGLAERLRKMREQALCPTCERKWDYGPLKVEMDKLDAEFRANEKILTDLDMQALFVPAKRHEVKRLREPVPENPLLPQFRSVRDELRNTIAQQRASYRTARSEYESKVALEEAEFAKRNHAARADDQSNALNAQARPVIAEKQRTVNVDRSNLDGLQRVLSQRQQDLQRLTTQNKVNEALEAKRQQDMARYQQAVEQILSDLQRARADAAAEQDFAAMIKSFLTAFFNEVVEAIAAQTNAILARVPNVAHLTVRFEEKVTARGPQIGTIVYINGEEKTLQDLSGGMETAVDLAVDLAVSAEVASRTGGRMPGWLVLDEPFTGLDSVCKEACMEILREAAKERLILVVDHATEFKEMFSQFVTISYAKGEARIVEAT